MGKLRPTELYIHPSTMHLSFSNGFSLLDMSPLADSENYLAANAYATN